MCFVHLLVCFNKKNIICNCVTKKSAFKHIQSGSDNSDKRKLDFSDFFIFLSINFHQACIQHNDVATDICS